MIRHGLELAEYQFFRGEPSMFRSPNGVVTPVLSGSSHGIIQLGLLLLIATPVARVAFSLLAFLLQLWVSPSSTNAKSNKPAAVPAQIVLIY